MLFFLFALSIGCTIATPDASRVNGGSPAEEGQFKYMALLKVNYTGLRSIYFPGSIISNQWILTTSQLAREANPEDVIAIVGTTKVDDSNGWGYYVSDIVVHPFNLSNTSNIALVKVKGHIILKGNVATVKLSSPMRIPQNLLVTFAAWGFIESTNPKPKPLHYIKLNTMNTTECRKYVPKINPTIHFCTASAGIAIGPCNGDIGAPLVYENYQIGLPDELSLSCMGNKAVTVYLKIGAFGDWIKQVSGVEIRSSKIV